MGKGHRGVPTCDFIFSGCVMFPLSVLSDVSITKVRFLWPPAPRSKPEQPQHPACYLELGQAAGGDGIDCGRLALGAGHRRLTAALSINHRAAAAEPETRSNMLGVSASISPPFLIGEARLEGRAFAASM